MSDTHGLAIERLIDAPVAAVWRAWTDHLAEWWCPKPWTTEIVDVDLRTGGRRAICKNAFVVPGLTRAQAFLKSCSKQGSLTPGRARGDGIVEGC